MDFIIEYFKKTIYCEHQIKKHCKFTNLELLYEKFQNHKFILCYGGHMLNVELLISLPLHTKEYGMCQLYLGNTKQKGKIAKWIQQNREKYGAICIPTSSPIKTLFNLKNEMDLGKSSKKGYLFGTLADYDTLSYKIPCSGVISRPAASTSCRSFFITSAGIHLRSTLTVRTRLRLRTMSIGA